MLFAAQEVLYWFQ